MKIEIDIPEKYITYLREAYDPEGETWRDNSDVSAADLVFMVLDHLSLLEV